MWLVGQFGPSRGGRETGFLVEVHLPFLGTLYWIAFHVRFVDRDVGDVLCYIWADVLIEHPVPIAVSTEVPTRHSSGCGGLNDPVPLIILQLFRDTVVVNIRARSFEGFRRYVGISSKLPLIHNVYVLDGVVEDPAVLANPVVVNLGTLLRKSQIGNRGPVLQEDLNVGRIRNARGTWKVLGVLELQTPLGALRITLYKRPLVITIHTHQLDARNLVVQRLVTETDELTVRICIPLRGLTGIPNRFPQMRNLEHVLRVVLLCIHELRQKAGISQAVILTVVVNSPSIRRNVVTICISDLSSRRHGGRLRCNNRMYKRSNQCNRERRGSNRSAATAYSSTLDCLLVHIKKSFP